MPCRVNDVGIRRVEIAFGNPPALSFTYDLVEASDDYGIVVHGQATYAGPWGDDVAKAVETLITAGRRDLMTKLFDDVEPTGFTAKTGEPGEEKEKKAAKPPSPDVLFPGRKELETI